MRKKRILIIYLFAFVVFTTEAQTSKLSITILNEANRPTPVRVELVHINGTAAPLPDEVISVQYGMDDRAQRFSYQPDSAWYVDGRFTVDLEPGIYYMNLTKGFEYLSQHHQITIEAGKDISESYKLERWIDMPERRWYSADDHIHIRRSPRDNPMILKWVAAEDVHVGVLLQMGDLGHAYYFAQYGWGKDGVYTLDERMLTSGQEDPRTHEIGHTISIGADEFVRFKNEYYEYDHVFDHVHELNGLTGYAHQGASFHGYRGMTMDVLNGKVDFLELLQFCVEGGPLLTENYYLFLDLGFSLTATAGSDFPYCGKNQKFVEEVGWKSQIGDTRFYTYIEDEFSFENWRKGFKAGHTFVSSGPMLELRINGKIPGDTLHVGKGEEVLITANAFGNSKQIPLERLEVIGHSKTIDYVTNELSGQSANRLTIEKKLKIDKGIWIAAQCEAGPLQYAHTTPIYISMDGGGFHNSETVEINLGKTEKYLKEIEEAIQAPPQDGGDIWRFKDQLSERIDETQEIINQLREKLK